MQVWERASFSARGIVFHFCRFGAVLALSACNKSEPPTKPEPLKPTSASAAPEATRSAAATPTLPRATGTRASDDDEGNVEKEREHEKPREVERERERERE